MRVKPSRSNARAARLAALFISLGGCLATPGAWAHHQPGHGDEAGTHDVAPSGATATEARRIELVMKAQFDKPESPLIVGPVSVQGDVAVAGWSQGSMGGRALLKKTQGQWAIALCGGDGLTQAAALGQTGMPQATADALARKIRAAEQAISPDRRKLFSSFKGLVKMGDGHPTHSSPAQGHNGASRAH